MNQRWGNSAEFAGEIGPILWHVSWYLAANRDRLSQDETSGGHLRRRVVQTIEDTMSTSPEGRLSAPIIVIEKRALIRETLARRLSEELGCAVVSFPDIDSWRKASSSPGAQFILVSAWENDHEAICALGVSESRATVIVLSDTTDLDDVVRSLKHAASVRPVN